MRHWLALAVTAAFTALPVAAQLVVNARAGMITYAEGNASILTSRRITHGRMIQLFEGETLDSKSGLAEMQLSGDSMVRIAKQSQLRMIHSALEDTELELVSGTAMLEVNRVIESGRLRIRVGDCWIELVEKGVYRFDTMPARLRVYDGKALVEGTPKEVAVKRGKIMDLTTHLPTGFDKKDRDPFHEWTATRSFQVFSFSFETRRRPSQWVRRPDGTYWSDAYALAIRRNGRLVTAIPHRP